MVPRALAGRLAESARHFPVVALTGPRQSGKTTLVRSKFPKHSYVSLETPDAREFALRDPRGFLAQFSGRAVLDEVQRAPELFSYIQTMVDEEDAPGRFILTGSHNFLLMQSVSQSLAGRCAVLHLLPFSQAELARRRPISMSSIGSPRPRIEKPPRSLEATLFAGMYPRIHDKQPPTTQWLASYYQTYVERDVRQLVAVGDLEAFGRFVRLCAGRTSQLLNLSGLAADVGVTHTTAKRWISVLEASFLIALLRPHHSNFGKRLIKTPKLHFLDSGLLCYLLGLRRPEEIASHSLRGAVFESFVVSEFYKNFLHRGETPSLYFWRTAGGREIDLLVELGERLIPVEIKSGQTVASDFFDGFRYWRKVSGDAKGSAALIYGGDQSYLRDRVAVHPWFAI